MAAVAAACKTENKTKGGFTMSEMCKCNFCGFEQDWESSDDIHGNMWSCDFCGTTFCSKCLQEYCFESYEAYVKYMQSGQYILCPECYEKIMKSKD